MAASTMQYSEHQLMSDKPKSDGDASDAEFGGGEKDGGLETDGDAVSMTLTIQSGMSRLSYMSRSSVKIKASSSFPNILSLYDPIQEESNVEKTVIKRKKKRNDVRRPRHQATEDFLEYRARQEQRAIRVEAVAREQLEKFDNYIQSMTVKVAKQREDRKRYNETLQERLREQQEIEKGKLRLHRRSKHAYVHDRSYLKHLPESRFCKTIRLADELQRRGVLRTRTDKDKFWAGTGDKQWKGPNLLTADSLTSVNTEKGLAGLRNPEIHIDDGDGDGHADRSIETTALANAGHDTAIDTTAIANTRQLPPIRDRERKKHQRT